MIYNNNFNRSLFSSFNTHKYILILSFLILSTVTSCKRNRVPEKIDPIRLKETEAPKELSLWAVTRYSDLKLREELTDNSSVLRYINQGSLLEIIKKSDSVTLFDGKRDYWYYVKSDGLTGWIFGAYIEIYNNIGIAERKCEEILFNTYEKNQQ